MTAQLVRDGDVAGVTFTRIPHNNLVIDDLTRDEIACLPSERLGNTQRRFWIRLDLRRVGVALRVDRCSGTTATGLLLVALLGVVSNRWYEAARSKTIRKVKSGR